MTSFSKIFFALVFSCLFNLAWASDGVLNIGCTTRCSILYKLALKNVAKNHRHKIRILDLSKQQEIKWNELHGLLIPGGADIDPEYYFPFIEPELVEYTKSLDYLIKYSAEGRRRDPFEYGLLREYFANDELRNIPVLGICRGMQMLAVSQGIPLFVDIKKELRIRNRMFVFDKIFMNDDKDTLMRKLFPRSFWAFKQHHQGIRVDYFQKHQEERWPHIKLTSFSHQGRIAESMEFLDRPILGVQFHSERDFGFERHSIFGWFLDKAEERHASLIRSP